MMFNITEKKLTWGGRNLRFETGRMARQADGAVLASLGETTVLCTVVAAKSMKPGIDFFPLTVNYQEKYFAAGKIPGGFFKREGRPTEKETLVSRLIDRPIRPLFAEGFRNETQVVCTLLSHDLENDPDIVAMLGASAALAISGLPFMGPIGAARVGYKNGQYLLNPTGKDLEESQLELVVAGTDQGVLMVESEAQELSEDIMLGAVSFGQKAYQEVIAVITELAKQCGKTAWPLPVPPSEQATVRSKLASLITSELKAAYGESQKALRHDKISAVKSKALTSLLAEELPEPVIIEEFKRLEEIIVRGGLLETKKRIDGRGLSDIRPIQCDVGILPRTHGSALFTRGETQALVVATLGTGQDEQLIDALDGDYRENFMLHYNFPPYSVGEVGRMGSPGRREIGHGKLAWRAVHPLLPGKDKFPYTIRIVSEITESNGSSSMATVCGTSLAM
ncbi:MAG: polyribonucleotide nucleotidyltransferase, partial [Alphaproteobacteria bacterium]|nr:polyribonucleotide nucleotidyltransferase [Alphaproteobacteria bacterium]